VVLLIALASGAAWPTRPTIECGLSAGVVGGIGLVFFFRALAGGHMGPTASIAGVVTAAVPVVYSLLTEVPPASLQLDGFALAAVAIWLVASGPGGGGRLDLRGVATAIIAGIAFGSMLVLLRLANGGALWPLVASRTTSAGVGIVCSLSITARSGRHSSRPRPKISLGLVALCVLCGLLDVGGNFLYTTSALLGRLDVAGVLSSLYPGFTILLAAWLLGEPTTRKQAIGMGLAFGAVLMISL